MPDFRIIDGGGSDKEDRAQQQAREWAKSDVERTVCEVDAADYPRSWKAIPNLVADESRYRFRCRVSKSAFGG
jgi:hypothetical protein